MNGQRGLRVLDRLIGAKVEQALHGQVGILANSGRVGALWPQHAELPSQLVLPRRGPVGVQQIPLIEHRVRHRSNPVETSRMKIPWFHAHGSLTRSALSNRSMTESQLVRPCSAL